MHRASAIASRITLAVLLSAAVGQTRGVFVTPIPETTVTQLDHREPDPAIFEIPSGYKVMRRGAQQP